MATNKLIFKDAEQAKQAIMASQQKEIAKLYEDWAKEIGKQADKFKASDNLSSAVSEMQMRQLQKQLENTSKNIADETQGIIKHNMYLVADNVVKNNNSWLHDLGFDSSLNVAFTTVADDVVQRLITGQIYDSGWSLSKRIWSDNQQTMKDAYLIMAKGKAENKSTYEIAKELEKYVTPGAKKSWNPMIKMKNTKTGQYEYKRIYKGNVDYNAQRLARTLTQHAYQQSFIATTQKNPFITKYQWSSNGSRPCALCMDRDGQYFEKDQLPMDHPNGQCTMIPVVDDDMIDKLADWFNSEDGTYPEIDEFAKNFGYDANVKTVEKFISKYGTSEKSPNAWFNSLTPKQKEYAKFLKEQSGLTWNKWYEQNIYSGDASKLGGKKKDTVKQAVEAIKNRVISTNSAAPEYTAWLDLVKKNREERMLEKETKSMLEIGEKGKAGIRVYSGSSYNEMNAYLRCLQTGMTEEQAIRESNISSSQLKSVKDAMSGLAKSTFFDEPLVLRRGTDLGDIAGAFMTGDFFENRRSLEKDNVESTVKNLNDKFEGAIGKLGSFTSTSSLYDRGFDGDVEIIFYAPQGTQGSSIMSISRFGTSEGETLLNADTTVRFVKAEESDGHKYSDVRVFLEIIPK